MKTSHSLDPTKRSNQAKEFEAGLKRKMVGQDHAVDEVVEIYQLFNAGLNAPGRPIGNLLLLGPTGTGKTRLFESVCEVLYGNINAGLKIDCAEFQHSHEIAKLIGSPPGYLGHRETHPFLTQEHLNECHTPTCKVSLLLLDEIEKASDALWNLLLGILDKATLTLGDNRRVDFSQTMIFMTSNLGATEMGKLYNNALGFQGDRNSASTIMGEDTPEFHEKVEKTAKGAAKKKFTPEFMNRLDKVIVFKNLKTADFEQILDIELASIQQRVLMAAGAQQFVFITTPEAKAAVLKEVHGEGESLQYGARHLKRILERNFVIPFANLVSTGQVKLGDYVKITHDGTQFLFDKEAEGAMIPALLERYANEAALVKPKKK